MKDLLQVKLARGKHTMVVWIEKALAVKGKRLTDGKKEWEVVEVYRGAKRKGEIHTDWKVGGLV